MKIEWSCLFRVVVVCIVVVVLSACPGFLPDGNGDGNGDDAGDGEPVTTEVTLT